MKPMLRSFALFVRQITGDGMLFAVLLAPLLAACAFRFGIPALEALLCGELGLPSVLSGYYRLFDIFLAALTPYMFCFASSLVILTECDEQMAVCLAVTPVGKKGYIVSRLVFPAGLSFFASLLLLGSFSLTDWTLPLMLSACLLTGALSVAVCLLLVSFSHNRVEGMALGKLSGIMLLGLPVPFFLFSEAQYLFSPLPSFWIAKLCAEGNYFYFLPALAALLGWIVPLYGRFERRLS